jgi:hypothetical protein
MTPNTISKCEDLPEIPVYPLLPVELRKALMDRETWIRNVMRIYPDKTRQETEELFSKIAIENAKDSY